MATYQQYVEMQRTHNPCLSNLCEFLSNSKSNENTISIHSLNFLGEDEDSETKVFKLEDLSELLSGFPEIRDANDRKSSHSEDSNKDLKLLIVQDLNKCVIELLGSTLDIDPLFFASHIHSVSKYDDSQTPDLAVLPSRERPQRYINVHYHRTILLEGPSAPPHKLLRQGNIKRKVAVLPLRTGKHIGLAQHCVSILYLRGFEFNLGIVLVDPPLNDRYYYYEIESGVSKDIQLRTHLYLGGYEDFLDPPSVADSTSHKTHPHRRGLLEDLLYYWVEAPLPSYLPRMLSLGALAYIPLRIVASEWTNYVAIMQRSVKTYEYGSNDHSSFLDQLDKLNADLKALQSWRRRSVASQQKLRSTIRQMKSWLDANSTFWLDPLIKDYEYLGSSISESGIRLEKMVPVVTSLVQVVDSRRSYTETANVTRLTILALIFVPLTFVSSVFSMSADFAPGGPLFWIYFAVAIPVTLCVTVAARPSFLEMLWLLKWLRISITRNSSSKRSQTTSKTEESSMMNGV